jgi:sugar lactone lactonase YvrE
MRSALAGVLIAAAAAACGSDNHSTGPHTGGTLAVTVTAPTGVIPAVTVTGPASYQEMLAASQTFTNLASGSYTVTATNVTTTDPIAPAIDSATITGSPATVSASATATVTVAYAPRTAGSGALWVGGGNGTVISFTGAQLQSSGSPSPANTLASGGDPLCVAIDAAGNLWTTQFVTNAIQKFTPAQLVAGGTPTAAVTLSGAAIDHPQGLAFDAQGNLWVASRSANTVIEYTAAQLTATGTPTPAVTITATTSPAGPSGIAFDASGNLWVANFYANTVVEYTPSQLATSGTPTPTVTLTTNANSFGGPFAVAFDASGTLWVSNANGTALTVVGLSSAQLAAGGSPVPASTITLPTSLNSPAIAYGLAFDASGNLWISDALNSLLYYYTPAQLAAGGQPTPPTTISSTAISGPEGLAFDPHASTLPLH